MTKNIDQTILIVDDNPTNLEVLSKALIAADHQVAVALDGESAIAQIQYKPPILILLDIMMPGIDGFETCRRLKADPNTQTIPIIFMTALSESKNKAKGFHLGAVDYITKPFESEEVLARVNTHLRLHQLTVGLEDEVASRTAELTTALSKLKQAQSQLIQSERMSLIGELSAGVAYEISNPVNFITGNLTHIEDYFYQLLQLINYYESNTIPTTLRDDPISKESISKEDLAPDLEFIRTDLPRILKSFERGSKDIQTLVSHIRTFAGTDQFSRRRTHLYELVDCCLTLLGHRLKEKSHRPTVTILKDYQTVSPVECYPAALSQALMGILLAYVNSIDIFVKGHDTFSPEISIQMESVSEDSNRISFSVNIGQIFSNNLIPETLLEPQTPGIESIHACRSSDLNLMMSHDIIVRQHGGSLSLALKPDQTKIMIELKTQLKYPNNFNSCT
ncbi:MAG: response regulator [Cyanobacteria bacterium P01_F01_bin.150]